MNSKNFYVESILDLTTNQHNEAPLSSTVPTTTTTAISALTAGASLAGRDLQRFESIASTVQQRQYTNSLQQIYMMRNHNNQYNGHSIINLLEQKRHLNTFVCSNRLVCNQFSAATRAEATPATNTTASPSGQPTSAIHQEVKLFDNDNCFAKKDHNDKLINRFNNNSNIHQSPGKVSNGGSSRLHEPTSDEQDSGTRLRTAYSSMQILNLEREFAINMYLSRLRRIELAQKLELSEKQVKIWFQNRRVKHKKEAAPVYRSQLTLMASPNAIGGQNLSTTVLKQKRNSQESATIVD